MVMLIEGESCTQSSDRMLWTQARTSRGPCPSFNIVINRDCGGGKHEGFDPIVLTALELLQAFAGKVKGDRRPGYPRRDFPRVFPRFRLPHQKWETPSENTFSSANHHGLLADANFPCASTHDPRGGRIRFVSLKEKNGSKAWIVGYLPPSRVQGSDTERGISVLLDRLAPQSREKIRDGQYEGEQLLIRRTLTSSEYKQVLHRIENSDDEALQAYFIDKLR